MIEAERRDMQNIRIMQIRSKQEIKRFINFHYDLYEGNAYWAPPLYQSEVTKLHPIKNPGFSSADTAFWLALDNVDKVVGRIAGIISYPFNAKNRTAKARFWMPDFVDDEVVSRALFERVEKWARDRGMKEIHGPMGFTSMDHQGILVEGFDELSTVNVLYNAPYYGRHLEKLGYEKERDWMEFRIFMPKEKNELIRRTAQRAAKAHELRSLYGVGKKELVKYAVKLFESMESAYAALPTHVPLSGEQIKFYIEQNIDFIPPEFISIVVDKNDEVAAFGVTMPSLTRALQKCRGRLFPLGWYHLRKAMKHYQVIDLVLVGVRPDLQGKGVNAIVFDDLMSYFLKRDLLWAEAGPELDSNHKVQSQWKYFNREQHKRRRLFCKVL